MNVWKINYMITNLSKIELTIWATVIMIELEKKKSAQQAIETADVIIEARRLRFTNDPQT